MRQRALKADTSNIDSWWGRAAAGIVGLLAAAFKVVLELTHRYLLEHAEIEGRTVEPELAEWVTEQVLTSLRVTGPVAFKRAIREGSTEATAVRLMATQMAGASERLVLRADRDTVQSTVEANGEIVGWRRVGDGDPCAFCAMLIGRGAVYKSGRTAGDARFGGTEYHDHDRCTAEPLYEGEDEPGDVALLQDKWQEVTAGKSGEDALRAWREWWDGGGREDLDLPAAANDKPAKPRVPFVITPRDPNEVFTGEKDSRFLGLDDPQDAPRESDDSTDPALKMTIAQLKRAGKDAGAGVLLGGVTRKADILRVLRDWESTRNVKIPGLPEWKPPRVVKPAADGVVAPALGVPSKSGKVLSGAMLNDWADHFTYDLQYGRHEFVNANGDTPAEGVRVRDLRITTSSGGYTVAHGTAWRFDGIAYLVEHGPNDFGSPWVSRTLTDLRSAHDTIPSARIANKSYAVVTGANPDDAYWREKYKNPNHVSAMTASRGRINIWNTRAPYGRVWVDGLRHETGHNLDDMIERRVRGSQSEEWTAAAASDVRSAARIKDLSDRGKGMARVDPDRGYPNGVTGYGRSSAAEDFAESVMLYQLGEVATGRLKAGADMGPLYFRDIYPARAKILDTLFPDIAKEQIAALKALRSAKPVTAEKPAKVAKVAKTPTRAAKPAAASGVDLSKLTVPKLKALAKERGLKGYSKLTRPRLLELLR